MLNHEKYYKGARLRAIDATRLIRIVPCVIVSQDHSHTEPGEQGKQRMRSTRRNRFFGFKATVALASTRVIRHGPSRLIATRHLAN